jgi:hypothetical protein
VCTCVDASPFGGDKYDTCHAGTTALTSSSCADSTGDLLILLDTSSGASDGVGGTLVGIASDIIARLQPRNGDGTRVGVILFSDGARVLYDLDAHTSSNAIMRAILQLGYSVEGGVSRAGNALSVARGVLSSTTQGARTSAPDTVLLLTASPSSDDTEAPVASLISAGARVVVIGYKAAADGIDSLLAGADDKPGSSRRALTVADQSAASSVAGILALETQPGMCRNVETDVLGCEACSCNTAGVKPDEVCDPATGICPCKERVEGVRCDRCRDGFARLEDSLALGCSGVPSGQEAPVASPTANGTQLLIQWDPPANLNGTLTSYSLLKDGSVVFSTTNTTVRSYVDADITPASRYTYAVRAATPAGSVTSETVLVQAPDGRPEGMSPPVLTALNATMLNVRWAPPSSPNGAILSYIVQLNGLPAAIGLAREAVIEVSAFTTYQVTVAACNSAACTTSSPSFLKTPAAREWNPFSPMPRGAQAVCGT